MSCEMLLARMYHLACIEVFELHMILGRKFAPNQVDNYCNVVNLYKS